MIKKVGKKKLVGILTVAAIVVTMAGSFALWDQLSTSGEQTLKIDTPVKTTMTLAKFNTEARALGDTVPSYTSAATYNVENLPNGTTADVLLKPEIKVEEAAATDNFDVTVKKGDTTLTKDGTGFKDTAVGATNTYTVVVSPKDDTYAGKTATVTLNAELKDATPTN